MKVLYVLVNFIYLCTQKAHFGVYDAIPCESIIIF